MNLYEETMADINLLKEAPLDDKFYQKVMDLHGNFYVRLDDLDISTYLYSNMFYNKSEWKIHYLLVKLEQEFSKLLEKFYLKHARKQRRNEIDTTKDLYNTLKN